MSDARLVTGLLARALFWACALDIVLNAIAQAVGDKQYLLAAAAGALLSVAVAGLALSLLRSS